MRYRMAGSNFGAGEHVSEVDELVDTVEEARQHYLAATADLSANQGTFQLNAKGWSIAQITEHLVHAELGGINLIWRAAEGVLSGAPLWAGESPNRGLTIEEVVQRTWRPRETSPDSAIPRVGGPLGYWAASLRNCTGILRELKFALLRVPLEEVVYPHVLSGPLDARQRLQFLAFHLDRHRRQVAEILSHPYFPQQDGNQRLRHPPVDV
jgi:hypothetical protein